MRPDNRIISYRNQEYVLQKKLEIGGCQIEDCPRRVTKENSCCFDWDHINPEEKVTTISNMVCEGRSISIIEEELKKCRLLCASSFHYVSKFARSSSKT